jgi:hypothetical protein
MLEVSRGAVKAGEEQLVSFAEDKSKYCSICTGALDPRGDLPVMNWGRWQCLRGGAGVGLNSCYAVCSCGTECRCGALPEGDVWRNARSDGARCPFAAQRGDDAHCPSQKMLPFHSTQAAGSKFSSKVLWT